MGPPFIVQLKDCTDPVHVGGKAAGLGRLMQAGFRVPAGFCLATGAYHDALRAAGFDAPRRWRQALKATGPERDRFLSECRQTIRSLPLADALRHALQNEAARHGAASWAVRSSATDEDAGEATYAGVYATVLGASTDALAEAIRTCWASPWTPTALFYHERARPSQPPGMAVVLQPMLAPQAAGVAYSQHPITGRPDVVVINAVRGLAEPLVSGRVIPDQLVVRTGDAVWPAAIIERHPADAAQAALAISDGDALTLAEQVRAVAQHLGHPVDVEWALADGVLWFLQARPIPTPRGTMLTESLCVWSRANFKETLPELPSPLGLSFLGDFMEQAILRHYRRLGCFIPPGMAAVRVIHGRPYLNASLFQFLMAQLGGDPDAIADQVGGWFPPLRVRPPRLPLRKLIPAGLWMERQIRRAVRVAPRWFADIRRLDEAHRSAALQALAPESLLDRLDQLSRGLYARDLTFATVGGVSQGLYVLRRLLERRLGRDSLTLLNASLQGRSRVISAHQIFRIMDLADTARREPAARTFFLDDPWEPARFRDRLAGTAFLREFDGYLADFGHRAVGESDMMVPRFAERPDDLLAVVRSHLQQPPVKSVSALRREQDATRVAALQRIRAAFGWRVHEWWIFCWWHRRLARLLALREANRHALMHFATASRRILLLMGRRFTDRGGLQSPEDIFFLTFDEVRELVRDQGRDWKRLVTVRRAERERNARMEAPATVLGIGPAVAPEGGIPPAVRTGLPISPGCVEGPARLIRSPDDRARVRPGDILIVPAIDPGLAPLFGVAAGVVAEMGGTLSHGAIILREFGLPALANVSGAMRWLADGERIRLDASSGMLRRLDA
jgi:pyruvate,water dikinase